MVNRGKIISQREQSFLIKYTQINTPFNHYSVNK
jgi:hypothetical protein